MSFNESRPASGMVDGLILGLIAVVVYVVTYFIAWLCRTGWQGAKTSWRGASWIFSWWKAKSSSPNASPNPVSGKPPAAFIGEPVLMGANPALYLDQEIQAGEIRTIDLQKDARLSVRFYASKGKATGVLTISSQKLRKALGFSRTSLAECDAQSMAEAAVTLRKDADALIAGQELPVRKKRAVVQPAESVQVEQSEAGPIYEEPPPFADEDLHQNFEPVHECELMPEPVTAPPEQTFYEGPPKEKELVYTGIFLGAGYTKRTKGERTFDQFRVQLLHDELRTRIDVWGNDLERVVQDSNVTKGQRVEIAHVGDLPVNIRGKQKVKKIWTLEII